MTLRLSDAARKRTNRFKEIDDKIYIHRSFPNIYKDKVLLCEELYFKAREYFETDYTMARYFAPLIGEETRRVFSCFHRLQFWQKENRIYKTLRLIDEFDKFLKEKK